MKEDLSVAIALHRNGQLSKAEKIYLNLLKENKNNVPILQLLGTIYLQIKNYELSEKYFLKCLEKEPKNSTALKNHMIFTIAQQNKSDSLRKRSREDIDRVYVKHEDIKDGIIKCPQCTKGIWIDGGCSLITCRNTHVR